MEDKYPIITGKNPVYEALRSNRTINKIFIAEAVQKSNIKSILSLAKEKDVVIQFIPKQKLDKIAHSTNHQGIVAETAAYSYVDLTEIISKSKGKGKEPFLIMLDGIEDPHNLGSILRTADVVGVDGVIIPKRRSASLSATVAKTSAGAVEYVPVTRVTNLAQTLDQLKKEGYWIVGTDASAKEYFTEIDYSLPICLIIGSEGKGISKLIKEKCDFFVSMPMKGHINSLNASVAAAIIMYEVYRQRDFK